MANFNHKPAATWLQNSFCIFAFGRFERLPLEVPRALDYVPEICRRGWLHLHLRGLETYAGEGGTVGATLITMPEGTLAASTSVLLQDDIGNFGRGGGGAVGGDWLLDRMTGELHWAELPMYLEYVKHWCFGLCLEVFGHYFAHFGSAGSFFFSILFATCPNPRVTTDPKKNHIGRVQIV